MVHVMIQIGVGRLDPHLGRMVGQEPLDPGQRPVSRTGPAVLAGQAIGIGGVPRRAKRQVYGERFAGPELATELQHARRPFIGNLVTPGR